jgi:predicted nucleic-acid-binding Zn-ribbon protein
MEERKRARSYAERFKNEKLKCPYCGNTNIAEMVVGEKTFQLMDKHKTTQVDERFQKELSVYCNKCATQIR